MQSCLLILCIQDLRLRSIIWHTFLKSINIRVVFCRRGLCGFPQKSIFFLLGTSVAFLARYDGPRYVIFLSGSLTGLCWWKKIHKEHAVQNNICHWCGRNRKLHKQFGNYRFITTGVKSYRPFLTLNYPLVPGCAQAKYLVSLHASPTSIHQDRSLLQFQAPIRL